MSTEGTSGGLGAALVTAARSCPRESTLRHEYPCRTRALPPMLMIKEDTEVCAWLETAAADLCSAEPKALTDRVLDWAWCLAGPNLTPALQAFHSRPSKGWTVASLAAESGVSRALFAGHFTEAMGCPPLTYLTVAEIAKSAGYADAFGFSAA